MARCFQDDFTDGSCGDIDLVITPESAEQGEEVRLRCHSRILTQHSYFYNMLCSAVPPREGLTKEVHISEPCEAFAELIRFIHTNQVNINRGNVATLLTLADKYCIDKVVDLSLSFIGDNLDEDMFFSLTRFNPMNAAYKVKLWEQLMSAIRQRRNLCSISEDRRWQDIPIALVEELLSQDDLPVSSEAEVLTLIARWLGGRSLGQRGMPDVARLLGAFRKWENLWVRVSDIQALMQAVGLDLFSEKKPRNGSAVWDPAFVIQRHEAAGEQSLESADGLDNGEVYHQLGPKDILQQEPGWMYPGVHRCRVSLSCTSWSHRERRLRSCSSQVPMLQRHMSEWPPSAGPGNERSRGPLASEQAQPGRAHWSGRCAGSPATPPAFQVRVPPLDSFEGQLSEGMAQDRIDHELVDHQIICGVSSGYQRHGVRLSQREMNAIYLVEDLNIKQSLKIGGTTSTVCFDLELMIGDSLKCGIRSCCLILIKNSHKFLEEWFDVSARVPLHFYITSSCFDKSSSYAVAVRWLKTKDQRFEDYDMHD